MCTAQICHHMYRKGSKCKGFTKSLNFWRTVRETSLPMVTGVTLSVSHAQALGSRCEGLYSSSSHHPQTQEATHVAGESLCDSGLGVIVPDNCPITPSRAGSATQDRSLCAVRTHRTSSYVMGTLAGVSVLTHTVYIHPYTHVFKLGYSGFPCVGTVPPCVALHGRLTAPPPQVIMEMVITSNSCRISTLLETAMTSSPDPQFSQWMSAEARSICDYP